MEPIEVYRTGRSRAEHLLKLSELLLNQRQRRMRDDWATSFKDLMRWRVGENIDRVDGEGALLILRESCGVTAEHFREDYLNELLRAAIVSIVSAFYRYCHELIAARIVKALSRAGNVSGTLLRFRIPVVEARKAILHAKKAKSRPMNLVRESVRSVLHEDTFQRPDAVAKGLRMIGIDQLWTKCGAELGCEAKEVMKALNRIIDHRNRIVHEGDIQHRARGGKIKFHKISAKQVADDIIWLSGLVDAIERVVKSA